MKETSGFVFFLAVMALILASIYGWIANLVTVFYTMGDPITGTFIARCVGIFFVPVGIVLGYL